MLDLGVTRDSKVIQMCCTLAEKLRIMEGRNSASMNALEMCLVLDMVIPPRFKVSNFQKYKGLSYPNIHVKIYCHKMVVHARDDKLMIHCFQDSLFGASLEWYMQLERNNVHTCAELAKAFS